ncbi:MAG: radical SAM/SPASM domain-containing protein [Sulfurimonadaceae bacterium]|nr:radical SAM/SPASM domain-containing protein [Sulfurimonadaceae bacterium]
MFKIVYVEVSNICGLACSFCPPKPLPNKTMSLDFFKSVLEELVGKTKLIALHVMGDPLVLSNLREYLSIAHFYGFLVELTTSGYYMNNHKADELLKKPLRQLNISLNAFNKNSLNISLDEYMDGVFNYVDEKLKNHHEPFINLRLWNLDEQMSESEFNKQIFAKLKSHFKLDIDTKVKSFRLAPKVRLHFDSYFEWPSLSLSHFSHGSCYGLSSQIAILASGVVVPCCLDGDGVINLGDLHTQSLDGVLSSKRAKDILEGFKKGVAVEELCQKCSFKSRFV